MWRGLGLYISLVMRGGDLLLSPRVAGMMGGGAPREMHRVGREYDGGWLGNNLGMKVKISVKSTTHWEILISTVATKKKLCYNAYTC